MKIPIYYAEYDSRLRGRVTGYWIHPSIGRPYVSFDGKRDTEENQRRVAAALIAMKPDDCEFKLRGTTDEA